MSKTEKFIRLGATSILVFGIAFPLWGQESSIEAAPLEVAPIPQLIDVWDAAKVRVRRPLLIAHRGGVVAPGAPECSQMAVKMAAAHRYDMVELDIWESKDHHPVVFHDQNMMRACGINAKISDFTLEAVTQIRFLKSDEAITSLDVMLDLCRSLNLGVMFDIKSPNGDDLFFNRVVDLIEKHDLDKASVTISGSPKVRKYLEDLALLTVTGEMLEKVKRGESVDLSGFFWFGLPSNLLSDLVKPLQKNGALVIPAINTFRYSEENHRIEAREDVERLLEAGVDSFQIDSIYQDYFGRSKVQEAK